MTFKLTPEMAENNTAVIDGDNCLLYVLKYNGEVKYSFALSFSKKDFDLHDYDYYSDDDFLDYNSKGEILENNKTRHDIIRLATQEEIEKWERYGEL